jgi:hypothetical protein
VTRGPRRDPQKPSRPRSRGACPASAPVASEPARRQSPNLRAIGSLVDRLFREARDPAVVLGDLVAEVRTSLYVPDAERTFRRFLEVAVDAYDATSGTLRWASEDGAGRSITAAGPSGREAEGGRTSRAPARERRDAAIGGRT